VQYIFLIMLILLNFVIPLSKYFKGKNNDIFNYLNKNITL